MITFILRDDNCLLILQSLQGESLIILDDSSLPAQAATLALCPEYNVGQLAKAYRKAVLLFPRMSGHEKRNIPHFQGMRNPT